ncbi:hypothetical protein, conserved [Leishmania tarentolae]|uniref:Cyclin N-terminal domain-containing protein n=1 Tax=Leishmania tarentolae TaxID=5689 RepID=A0A640KJH5_LEITA|nr:hypothetical protein, conserved [Leishmania tarentolae]
MSTAVFELFGKLARVASSGQQGVPSALERAPTQMLLPTDEECVLYGQKKPIVFFYEPRGAQQLASGAADGKFMPGAGAAVTSSSSACLLQGWPSELSAVQLASPETTVRALRVTNAEDDLHKSLSTQEVWSDWPQTIRGWQLCPMSHLCAVMRTNASARRVYLLATRYELVGTSAVYERYLLLAPRSKDSGRDASSNALARATTAADSASISITELRTLRRIACLCRCFCSSGGESQPRTARSRGLGSDTLVPPLPLADYVLHLVPTSLQYTFCFAATALLSAADDERCQSWAMTSTALSRIQFNSRHLSCSTTEAANTSGALSDGGHTTYFESATQSRDRSTSAVRVVEGGGGTTSASGVGFNEDPRSAPSTPARPLLAMGSMDEQHGDSLSAVCPQEDMHQEEGAAVLEERLPPSQRWRAMALRRLLDTSFYNEQVPAGWKRWRYASSGILCRPLVVDSLDGIIRYIHGSRLAFYTAVAFLDRFIAVTVDPLANFFAYKRQVQRSRSQQEMDCRMLAMYGMKPIDQPIAAELGTERLYDNGLDGGVQAREICSFLTQVIVVCIMLGSKTVDLYPPRIRSLMGCVEDTAPISEEDFVILEFHVLLTLGFPVHPVTLFEAVGALLTFSTSDALFDTLTASHTTRRLLEEHEDRGHLVHNVDKLMQEEAEAEEAAAVAGSANPRPVSRAAALTPADRRAINDWLRLRLFTCFICDEVIRANAGDSSSSSSTSASSSINSTPRRGGGGSKMPADDEGHVQDEGVSVLQFSPVLVAAAALVIAAEQLRMPLPAPLLRLVPVSMQARLREAPVDGSSDSSYSSGGSSSGRNMTASHRKGENLSTCDVAIGGLKAPGWCAGAEARHSEASTGLRLTAAATDDHYKVLMELSLLVEQELNRLSDDSGLHGPPPPARVPVAGATTTSTHLEEEEQVRAGSGGAAAVTGSSPSPAYPSTGAMPRGGAAQRGASLCSASPLRVRPASTRAIEMFGRIIARAKAIHHRSRGSCQPVLLHRYQSLFRDGI